MAFTSICSSCRSMLLARLHARYYSRLHRSHALPSTSKLVPILRRGFASSTYRQQSETQNGMQEGGHVESTSKAWTPHNLPPDLHSPRSVAMSEQRTTEGIAIPGNQEQDIGALLRPDEDSAPEDVALRARNLFGDRLPERVLRAEELQIYERLYGPPLWGVAEEQDPEEVEEGQEKIMLLKETADGELEEVEYAQDDAVLTEDAEEFANDIEAEEGENAAAEVRPSNDNTRLRAEIEATISHGSGALTIRSPDARMQEEEEEEDLESDAEDADIENTYVRTHPYTAAGRFGTFPSTLPLPASGLTEPVSMLLANVPNKHLDEAASKIFGGTQLPYGPTCPPVSKNMPQKPLPISATQSRMTEMEADVYLATAMPGIYASIMSVLVETRKRLGSAWIEGLMAKPDGPRILDAGAAGAGVLAWREVIKAEWSRLHPTPPTLTTPDQQLPPSAPVPLGKATVLTGSAPLRQRASVLLDNTTFVPRLPDYIHTHFDEDAQKKQFDIIIAPHSLWHLQEDFERRQRVLNLWSLLDPNSGVLILLEKGVPRGFEVVADAREYLLRELFEDSAITSNTPDTASSPSPTETETVTTPPMYSDPSSPPFDSSTSFPNAQGSNRSSASSTTLKSSRRAPARIIGPCTSHAKCPMYLIPGISRQRKDYCHFSQRFERPTYLQRMLGAKDRNHDDVKFSYVAIQKGVAWHAETKIHTPGTAEGLRGDAATERAFAGFDTPYKDLTTPTQSKSIIDTKPSHFTHPPPRLLLPPLKRTGHILLDVCTPSGTLERWTVTKSFGKQAYRDARKAKWGDLWMLGAKFRADRRVRLGWGHMMEGIGTGRGVEAVGDAKLLGKKVGKKKGRKGRDGEVFKGRGEVRDVRGRVKQFSPHASAPGKSQSWPPSFKANKGRSGVNGVDAESVKDANGGEWGAAQTPPAETDEVTTNTDTGPTASWERKAWRRVQKAVKRSEGKKKRRDGVRDIFGGGGGGE